MTAGTPRSAKRKPGNGTRRIFPAGTLALIALLSAGMGSAVRAETALNASYAISVGGVTIGAAEAESRFTDAEYAIIIKGRTSGISRLVSDARATLLGSGRIAGTRLVPASYDLEASEGAFETHVRMKMRAGAITDLLAIPSLRDARDRVPLAPQHKRNVLDPVAAFVVVADKPGIANGRRLCRRTIRVFDGWQRFDVGLSFKEIRTVDGTGEAYDGKVVVCTARYVPVAGHRPSLGTTRYMTENKRLEVWYAPIDETSLLVPYRILIGTKFGDLVITATRLVATNSAAEVED